MANGSFMDRLRNFLGIRQEPPRNDFRNPIWSSDDEDEGDDLYTRQTIEAFTHPAEMHQEFAKHMQDMFKSFGSMFGDIKLFFNEDHFESMPGDPGDVDPENFNSKSIRDYYLKPGFHKGQYEQPKEDIDLDGKVSSNEISGLLKQKDPGQPSGLVTPFNGNLVPGRSFCQTIITTSVTKPDGTIETRRIVKNGNEVIEETTTSSGSSGTDMSGHFGPSIDAMTNTSIIYGNVMSDLSSLFKNFY